MKDLQQVRETLHLLKPKTLNHFKEDRSTGQITNLDEILEEYNRIAKVAKDLIPLPGKSFQEALSTQASEFHFFRTCVSNLKRMLDFYEALLRYTRGKEYRKIRDSESREFNDRAINSLIDSKDNILALTFDMLKVKEMHDKYVGIVESYNQRGYSLNNLTKGLEIAVMDTLL